MSSPRSASTQAGEATGVNTVMHNVGSAVGAQIGGTVIAGHVLASGVPENTGSTIALLVSAIGACVTALSVLLIPRPARSAAAVGRRRRRAGIS